MKRINLYAILSDHIYSLKVSRLVTLIICLSVLLSTGCRKDLLDASSNRSKEFMVVLPKDGGTIIRGLPESDTIKAQLQIPGQPVTDFDTTAYAFTWVSFQKNDTLSTKSYLTSDDFANQDPTLITCLLTVREKSTGITKYSSTDVFVTTPTREGWVLLEDKAGKTKFSMLTYTANGYRRFTDLATELGLDVSLKGKPFSISTLGTENILGLGKYQWLGVVTDQEIKIIQTTDFVADAAKSDYVTSIMQPSESSPVTLAINGVTNFVATKNTDIYYFNLFDMNYQRYSYEILNAYPPPLQLGGTPFRASPHHTFTSNHNATEYSRMMFDDDEGVFVRAHKSSPPDINGVFPLQLNFSTKGFKLKAITTLKGPEVDEITALLHNPTTSESYIIQFLSNGIVENVKAINYADVVDMLASKSIEIDLNAGYLIYTKGHEVLAYDYNLGQTFSLLNVGNETISLIKILHHYPPTSKLAGRADLYKELLNRLVICTYDAAHPDDSGTFRTFHVQLGHQAPIVDIMETGFPKIVDVTFAPIL